MSVESQVQLVRHAIMRDIIDKLAFDGPMNDAAWAFSRFYNHDVPVHIFNNTKAGLITAFKTYLEQTIKAELDKVADE